MKRLMTLSLIGSVTHTHTHTRSCKRYFRDNWENLNMQLLFNYLGVNMVLWLRKYPCLEMHVETVRGGEMGQPSKVGKYIKC